MGEDRPDAAKSPQKGEIKANEQGFQRANDTLNEKNDKKIGNRKKNRSYGEVFQRPAIAFEVQLSTTFLNVMRERRQFYLENNGLLFWIFKNVQTIEPRQFQDDVFYCNNSNIFVVDDETTELSIRDGRFMLRCFFLEPDANGEEVWRTRIVPFDQLTIDQKGQRVFYFDNEAARYRIQERNRVAQAKTLRERFVEFMSNYSLRWDNAEARSFEYQSLCKEFAGQGIELPPEIKRDFLRFNTLVLSAHYGKPVGTRHDTLLQVANYAYDHCRNLLWYFLTTLSLSQNLNLLLEQDKHAEQRKRRSFVSHASWKEKLSEIREGIRQWRQSKTGGFPEDRSFDDLYFFLFPDIAAHLKKRKSCEY